MNMSLNSRRSPRYDATKWLNPIPIGAGGGINPTGYKRAKNSVKNAFFDLEFLRQYIRISGETILKSRRRRRRRRKNLLFEKWFEYYRTIVFLAKLQLF